MLSNRLHDNGSQLPAIPGDDCFQFLNLIVPEWKRGASQTKRHTGRVEAGQHVASKIRIIREVGGKVPIMPTMITADRDLLSPGPGASNSHRDLHRLAAAARVTSHLSPRV